jgi:hypothetical protein
MRGRDYRAWPTRYALPSPPKSSRSGETPGNATMYHQGARSHLRLHHGLQDGRQNMEGHKAIEKPQARRTCAQPFTHAQPGDQGATVASNLDRARNVHAVARSLHPQSMRHSVVVKENFLVMPRCAKHAKPGCDMPVTHSLSFLGFWTCMRPFWTLVLDSNCTRFCRRLRKAPGRYDLK